MNTKLLSLLIFAPVLGYATHLLLSEYRQPLMQFHDEYRRQFFSLANEHDSRPGTNAVGLTQQSKYRRVQFLLAAIFLVIVVSGAGIGAAVPILIASVAYLFWVKRVNERSVAASKQLLELEFPAFVELFTILVVAGESPSRALLRISEIGVGEFSQKVKSSVELMRQGQALSKALEALSKNSGSMSVRRFCDSLIIAIDRGTSLSEVLYRQVEDIRRAQQTELLRQAGKAEIALMIPVVFLILPISVLFALWPSYLALGQGLIS